MSNAESRAESTDTEELSDDLPPPSETDLEPPDLDDEGLDLDSGTAPKVPSAADLEPTNGSSALETLAQGSGDRPSVFRQSGSELEFLKEKLTIRVEYVAPELREAIYDWLSKARKLTSGDAADHVLANMRRLDMEYQMYDAPSVDDPAEAFPEACADCVHFGGTCDIMRHPVRGAIRRLAADAESTDQFKSQVTELASLRGCGRIPEWIEEHERGAETVIDEGYELYRLTDPVLDLQHSGQNGLASADGGGEIPSIEGEGLTGAGLRDEGGDQL